MPLRSAEVGTSSGSSSSSEAAATLSLLLCHCSCLCMIVEAMRGRRGQICAVARSERRRRAKTAIGNAVARSLDAVYVLRRQT
jgi:ABC-type Fe3+ transport system permease subunit